MARVLVTGAAGFIGFHTANRLLARGDEVVGLDNLNSYIMDFVCEQVVFADEQFTFTACGGDPIFLGPGVGENGAYISGDDSSFTLVFQDDITDACGAGSPNVTLQWTKQ